MGLSWLSRIVQVMTPGWLAVYRSLVAKLMESQAQKSLAWKMALCTMLEGCRMSHKIMLVSTTAMPPMCMDQEARQSLSRLNVSAMCVKCRMCWLVMKNLGSRLIPATGHMQLVLVSGTKFAVSQCFQFSRVFKYGDFFWRAMVVLRAHFWYHISWLWSWKSVQGKVEEETDANLPMYNMKLVRC